MIDERGTLLVSGEAVGEMRLKEAIDLWQRADARTRLRMSFRAERLLLVPTFSIPRRTFSGDDFRRLAAVFARARIRSVPVAVAI